MSNKEKRGIYNVTLNEKNATSIKTDLELIEEAIIAEVTMYVKGWHNYKTDKGLGAKHIKLHLEKESQREINLEELLNLGTYLRGYKEKFNEPFIDRVGAKIYEWENNDKVRFRVVIDKMPEVTATHLAGISTGICQIISFYSDRNLKERMEFKNPKVKEYYAKNEIRNDKSLKIFKLCESLAKLLGDKEAIADLKTLHERHPEMFKDKEEVANLIQKVISEPEIIIKNPTAMSEKDYIAGKKLNEEKMGEVGVRKDESITKVFHANEKRLKNLDLLAKKDIVFDGRDAHTPYTQAQSLDGRLVDNNISSNTDDIIPNNSIFSNFRAKSKEIKNHTQRIDQKINKNKTPIQKNNQQILENQSSQFKTKRKNQ